LESVFLSYRREDSAGYAGRLSEHLGSVFGPEHVFMDVQDIAPGQDFAEAIEKTISGCRALIAVIGPHWAAEFRQRSGSDDYVLREVSIALRCKVTVIPVLVGGATMPSPAQLPEGIAALSRRQALEIRDAQFEEDTKVLVRALRQAPGMSHASTRFGRRMLPWVLVAGTLAITAGGIVAWKRQPGLDINGVWIAEMQKPNQRPFRVRLELVNSAGRFTGAVAYPTGDATIGEGTLEGNRLTFSTTHVPQFASEPATIRWSGIIEGNQLRLTAADDNGVARGLAHRSP
jgi:hypothetical protein